MTVPGSIRERSAFVDTSAFVALLNASDRDHVQARLGFRTLADERRALFTSNLIVAETYALVRRASGHTLAVRWLNDLNLNLLFASESDHRAARALLTRYADKRFSYADAISFVMIERLGIPLAVTFDKDFSQYGLAVMP